MVSVGIGQNIRILSFFTLSVHCSGGNRQQNSVQFDSVAVDPSLMTVADKDSDE